MILLTPAPLPCKNGNDLIDAAVDPELLRLLDQLSFLIFLSQTLPSNHFMKSLLNNPDVVTVMILVILDTWCVWFALLLGCRRSTAVATAATPTATKFTHVSWNPNFGIYDSC